MSDMELKQEEKVEIKKKRDKLEEEGIKLKLKFDDSMYTGRLAPGASVEATNQYVLNKKQLFNNNGYNILDSLIKELSNYRVSLDIRSNRIDLEALKKFDTLPNVSKIMFSDDKFMPETKTDGNDTKDKLTITMKRKQKCASWVEGELKWIDPLMP